jgi:hypothetical protein
MANYLLVYVGGGMPATEAESKAVMQEWGVWYEKLGDRVVDQGSPFTPMAKHITSDGKIGDGPAGTMVSGYTLIKAGSLDEAARYAQTNPVVKSGGQVSIFETFDMPGM